MWRKKKFYAYKNRKKLLKTPHTYKLFSLFGCKSLNNKKINKFRISKKNNNK